jgi:hypothetical protein
MTQGAFRTTRRFATALALACPLAVLAAPGDTLQSNGVLVDNDTGMTYSFALTAVQNSGNGGGDTNINIQGVTRACSVHGPGAEEGNFPYQGVQCGMAFGNGVSINGCVAELEAHGYVHSDHPNLSYLGSTTIDVRYQKSRAGDQMKVTIHTPKEKIQLIGKVMGAGAVMPSCS